MLTIQQLKQNPAEAARLLGLKKVEDAQGKVTEALALDEKRRSLLSDLESNRAEMNRVAKAIGVEMGKGNKDGAEALKTQTATIKQGIADGEKQVAEVEKALFDLLVTLPNMPHPTVPAGFTAEENVVAYESPRAKPTREQAPLPHWELAAKHNLIDFELGVKISGAGFPVYIGKGAQLQRAIIQWCLDQAAEAGYLEVQVPIVVNKDSGFGTGQLPDKEGQMYYVTEDDLYLIPTAEVPVTNLFRDEIVDPAQLPIRRVGYTPCFRREAGSYGAHVRGLNRLHQFDKVEIVQIAHPDNSYEIHEQMRHYVAGLLDALELPYRTLLLCAGDMSFGAAKCYDMEVWSAGQERWLEVSSISNFETFQANRLKLRTRGADGKGTMLAHTLNGSALALPRIVAGILENHQQPDGSIRIPKVLVPYTRFDRIG